MRSVALVVTLLFSTFWNVACGGDPVCPPGPTPGATYGPTAAVDKADVTLEFTRTFIRSLVSAMTKREPGDAYGATVEAVGLRQASPNIGQLDITLRIYVVGAGGSEAEIPSRFSLRLALIPVLHGSGMTLATAFRELSVSGDQVASATPEGNIACGKAFNFASDLVLKTVLGKLSSAPPTAVDLLPVLNILKTLSGEDATLDGVRLIATSTGIRIGLAMAGGRGEIIDEGADLHLLQEHRSPHLDWSVEIAQPYVEAAVKMEAGSKFTEMHRRLVHQPDQTSCGYGYDAIHAVSVATFDGCGNFRVTAKTIITLTVGDSRTDGTPSHPAGVLQASIEISEVGTTANAVQLMCAGYSLAGDWIKDLFSGFGTGTILNPAPSGCLDVISDPNNPLVIELGQTDEEVLYATEVTTFPTLAVGGRSVAVDKTTGPRPPVPACRR